MTRVVDEYVLRLDVFMYQTSLMDVAERRSQANREVQKTSHIEWLFPVLIQNVVEELTAGIREYKNCLALVARKCERLSRPGGIQFRCKGVFVFKSSQILRQWSFRGESCY